MPAEDKTELIIFQGWTLRVRHAKSPKRLLLMIHGLTGDENSMWVFARGLPRDYWMLAPRAPHSLERGGYSWRSPQYQELDEPGLDVLRSSAGDLVQLADAYAAVVNLQSVQFDLMGFSQGAALSSALTLLFPSRVRRLAMLAGFVPGALDAVVTRRLLEGKQVFVAHGTHDELVPVKRARQGTALLESAGARLTICEDDVGHKVSAACLWALDAFLAA